MWISGRLRVGIITWSRRPTRTAVFSAHPSLLPLSTDVRVPRGAPCNYLTGLRKHPAGAGRTAANRHGFIHLECLCPPENCRARPKPLAVASLPAFRRDAPPGLAPSPACRGRSGRFRPATPWRRRQEPSGSARPHPGRGGGPAGGHLERGPGLADRHAAAAERAAPSCPRSAEQLRFQPRQPKVPRPRRRSWKRGRRLRDVQADCCFPQRIRT